MDITPQRCIQAILCVIFGAICARAQRQPKSNPVVLTVAERQITASELCTAIGSLPPPQRTGYMQHPALAKDWFGPLVALAEEAKRGHLSVADSQTLSEVDLDNALAGELIQSLAQSVYPTADEVAAYYFAHQSDFEQAKARHIVISYATAFASHSSRSEAEAKAKADDIFSRLKHGADFAALASLDSDDLYTKSHGGDLGYVSHHQLEPALDSMLWKLAPGQTSAPFKGRFGYEIVRVEGRHTQTIEQVQDLIVGKIRSDVLERKQQQIISAAHIRLAPDFTSSPLPCETPSKPFTLKDSLQIP
jgi:PPIC-type PPIASE domain